MGCDFHILRALRRAGISIHAPAWGATILKVIIEVNEIAISIHAPAWGATELRCTTCGQEIISIHAPAWGATRLRRQSTC